MNNPRTNFKLLKDALTGIVVALSLPLALVVGLFFFPRFMPGSPGPEAAAPMAAVQTMPSEPLAPAKLTMWQPPQPASIPKNAEGELILYGQELIAHTANYLGL